MPNRVRLLVLPPVVLAMAGILFALGRLSVQVPPRSATALPASAPEARPAAANADVELARTAAETTATAEPERGTLRELLERYYGRPWAEIEPTLVPGRIDPDAQALLLPWTAVAAEFRGQVVHYSPEDHAANVRWCLEWPDGNAQPDWYDGVLNPGKKPLSQVDVQNLERIANEYQSHLTDLAEALGEMLPRCMADQWDRGAFTKAPLADTFESSFTKPTEDSQLRKVIASHGGGWRVNFYFESRNYPDLDQLSGEIRRVKHQRVDRVRDYIAAL